MTGNGKQFRRFLSGWRVPILAPLAWVLCGACANAQVAAPSAVRVEEDWELVVDQPATEDNGPQVTCAITPLSMDVMYAAFDVNYRTQPDYSPGGVQLHTWDPVEPIVTQNFPATAMLATPNETITWTMRMSLKPGSVRFRIVNGRSQTWGTFASVHSLADPTNLVSLDSYDPQVSVDNSGVSFASNLVVSLTLKAVRWYDASGNLIRQSSDPRVVYPKP